MYIFLLSLIVIITLYDFSGNMSYKLNSTIISQGKTNSNVFIGQMLFLCQKEIPIKITMRLFLNLLFKIRVLCFIFLLKLMINTNFYIYIYILFL